MGSLKIKTLALLTLLVFYACLNRKMVSQPELYQGEQIAIDATYLQTEIPGQQKDSSKTYLHIVVSISPESKINLKKVHFEGFDFPIENQQTTYQFKIPPTIDVLNKRMKYIKLYFEEHQQIYFLTQSVSTRESIFLP